jgi:hypothetical protein
MALVLIVLSLVFFGLIQLTTKRQIALSNEQLETILQSYKAELKNKIYGLLQN